MWLAGLAAPAVAALFEGSPFAAKVLAGPVGSASALKACFAFQSKALPTLWVQLDAAARAYGVSDEIREELHRTGVDLDGKLAGIDAQARGKAWRWVGEMQEAAETFAAVGLPDGFSRAAARDLRADGGGRPDRPREPVGPARTGRALGRWRAYQPRLPPSTRSVVVGWSASSPVNTATPASPATITAATTAATTGTSAAVQVAASATRVRCM